MLHVIDSFTSPAGGPGLVPAHCCRSVYFCKLAGTWDFLCVRYGSSTSNSVALQGFSLLPLLAALSYCAPPADLLLRAELCTNKHRPTDNGAQKSWRKPQLCALTLGRLKLTETCLQTCISSTYITWKTCQWISGSYGLSGVSLIPFLEKLDIEESLVLR